MASLAATTGLLAQAAPAPQAEAPAPATATPTDDETIVLDPFDVTADKTMGYAATTTLAGSRINTQLKDVGSAISVITTEFLKDTGATDNKSLLQYATSTEVGSLSGNFIGAKSGNAQDEGSTFTSPNTNTRVRGLTAADNTRNFFMTSIPWDSYNMDRVEMQRGPNSILFGMGSPAGIINTTTKTASFKNANELEFRLGQYGTNRVSLDVNHVLLKDELSARIVLLRNDEKYRQKPAQSLDKRIFATTRYEPKFLNRGAHKTTLKLNYEVGNIHSNNPRVISPVDYITPWFNSMNKATYNPSTVQDNNPHYNPDATTYYPANYGQAIPSHFDGTTNPDYQPWIGNFASSFGGPLAFFTPSGSAIQGLELSEYSNIRGIGSNGAIDKSIGGLPYARRVSVDEYRTYTSDINAKYKQFGLYKNSTLTDASIFDFYNKLLDGKNKKEWQSFNNYSGSLSQTFFDRLFGFELAYDRQTTRYGQISLLSDQRAGIYMDINAYNLDGTPNANVGKAFISDAGIYGNNTTLAKREAARATGFFDYDFYAHKQGNWLRKLLGRHVFTGLYSEDRNNSDSRNFMRWGTDQAYAGLVNATPTTQNIDDNQRAINSVIYLSDNLASRTSASGAGISGPVTIAMPSKTDLYYFDSTWKGTGIDPAAAWTSTNNGQATTQSENPANYVGWTKVSTNILSAENGDRDALTTSASLGQKKSFSSAGVWQGYLWDGAVVGMYGIRHDRVKSWAMNAPRSLNRADLTSSSYQLEGAKFTVVKKNSPSYSVVAHLNKFLGDRLPVNVSLYYNYSENFQVSGTRVDIYGNILPLPSGTTRDKGIMIATKDERFSFKVNKFVNEVKDASGTSGLNTWFLGTGIGWGSTWANVFKYNLSGSTMDTVVTDGTGNWRYNYSPGTGETAAQATDREDKAVAAWHALEAKIPQAYYTAWNFDLSTVKNYTPTAPAGFSLTEDQHSEGYEFEFTANPTNHWRVTFNASKITASRSNVGGAALTEFAKIVNDALTTTPAGDLRIWGGGPGNTTILQQWNGNFYSNYALMKLAEGTNSPELRKWRFNLVSSYDFSEGVLKGFNVGVGYRWQDKIAIGYKPIDGATTNSAGQPSTISFDLNDPYYGPTEGSFDFWIGYGKKLTDKVDWRIQLNVRDAFKGDSLIPLTTQPDGSVAAWRIAPAQVWTLTNTFKF